MLYFSSVDSSVTGISTLGFLFLFVFGFFMVFSSNSILKSTILAYLLENALTEYSMNLYYLYYNFTFPLSLFFSLFMIFNLDSFHVFMLILCICQFILIIIFTIFFYESQRFNFEYAYYTRITEFAVYILGENKFGKNINEYDRQNNRYSNLQEKLKEEKGNDNENNIDIIENSAKKKKFKNIVLRPHKIQKENQLKYNIKVSKYIKDESPELIKKIMQKFNIKPKYSRVFKYK